MSFAPLIALAAQQAEHSGNVMLETIWYPIVSLIVFGALACVALSYKGVSNRHVHKAAAYAKAHPDEAPQAGHGH
ncbi:hypothetical protein GCM10022240_23420 [Microbacterium kribbense]|uniref:4-hydroxybenzoate polyprenyltransferase n=1 Tax=Microbacterium kribbense TaxID=433645 RepID=A0ABP7GNN0_9MICO